MEDTYLWVYNIIESCNNDFHFGCADILISLFVNKYKEADRVSALKLIREDKWNAVHSVLT
ncbi:MAG: hypothetical protein Q8891_00880 [Bacteroidota bacterium]|nr:hypothetical protein [Bacteroidota bacterium]